MEVQEGEPGNKVAMDQLFKGKKGVLFAVPGAFTPGCSKVRVHALVSCLLCLACNNLVHQLMFCFSCCFQTHLPGFVEQAEALKSKGVQEVACISVNDAFVMAAWGKEHGTDGKVPEDNNVQSITHHICLRGVDYSVRHFVCVQ